MKININIEQKQMSRPNMDFYRYWAGGYKYTPIAPYPQYPTHVRLKS